MRMGDPDPTTSRAIPVVLSCRIRPVLLAESNRCCVGITRDSVGNRVLYVKNQRGARDALFKFDR